MQFPKRGRMALCGIGINRTIEILGIDANLKYPT